jgi:hypothetical protein
VICLAGRRNCRTAVSRGEVTLMKIKIQRVEEIKATAMHTMPKGVA